MTSTTANLLRIEDLYKFYGEKIVLDDIYLAASAGTFCSVVGPSGCGKSTLFRLILGEEQPTSGDIRIDGIEVTCPGTDRGIVYQRYSLYPHLTVLENVALGSNLRAGLLDRRHQFQVHLPGQDFHHCFQGFRRGNPEAVDEAALDPLRCQVAAQALGPAMHHHDLAPLARQTRQLQRQPVARFTGIEQRASQFHQQLHSKPSVSVSPSMRFIF